MLDLLRAKGIWLASVRYGYVFGGLASAGNLMAQLGQLWSAATLSSVTASFTASESLSSIVNASRDQSSEQPSRRSCMVMRCPYASFHSKTVFRNSSLPRSSRVLPSSA